MSRRLRGHSTILEILYAKTLGRCQWGSERITRISQLDGTVWKLPVDGNELRVENILLLLGSA